MAAKLQISEDKNKQIRIFLFLPGENILTGGERKNSESLGGSEYFFAQKSEIGEIR